MEEIMEKTEDEILLEDVLNELDINFKDEATTRKIRDIMQRGKARLERLKGSGIDFAQEMDARELLFSYCRYGRSNAIEQFEHDFSSNLTEFALCAALKSLGESGKEDEKEV